MIGIEIFSGAGGMSLGAIMAGIDVKMAIEIDPSAAFTFKINHPNAIVLNSDIKTITNVPIQTKKEDMKILFGGPPCQGFSRSNHRTRNSFNPNNYLFHEFARLTQIWCPDWIVLENVEGLIGTNNGSFVEQILDKFDEMNYAVSYKVLNAVNFGVPQKRTRLFIVGSIHGIKFEFPDETHHPFVTVKDAINDLPILNNGNQVEKLEYSSSAESSYAKKLRQNLSECTNHMVSKNTDLVIERYNFIPQGGNWQSIPSNIMSSYKDVTRCHTGIYHRLHEDRPSVVIGNYRKNMLVHPKFNRGLSVREAARLQSFPDWFEFKGALGQQQQQVGNAVPPYLAKAVFEKILSYN